MAWRRSQSHSRQLRQSTETPSSCDHPVSTGVPAWYARRSLQRAAVFGHREQAAWARRPAVASSVATGVITEVREEAIVLYGQHGLQSYALSPGTVTWLGAPATPSALRSGDPAIVRYSALGHAGLGAGQESGGLRAPRLAERIWARIGRVTGTIIAADDQEFLVDTGRQDRAPRRVVVARASARQIQVRFPRLAPGYLLDVIGTRHGDHLLAVAPATAQPPYRAGHAPAPPLVSGPLPVPISGSAVWHEPDDEPPDLLGLGYPALDSGVAARPGGGGAGCVRLPYLSLGSAVRISNECGGQSAVLPVTSDGAMARQFCDRCLTCGTSPKGRVADLTMAAFVELGGNLENGCFNATMMTSI